MVLAAPLLTVAYTLTLVRIISDAKTHITGTPVSMQEMMKQRMGNPNQ